MIWDIIEESNFDQHFNNPELTIQTLLLDENILTEMQNLNPRLIDFITTNRQEIINQLIEYVIVMPTEQQGYDRGHKLPYMSSEMLAIQNKIFYEAFFPNEKNNHLEKLFSFLSSTEAIENTLLLGYFEKVVNNLYKGKKLEFTKAVAQNIALFAKNLDKETIGSILKNCIILINAEEGILLQERKQIIQTIIKGLVDEKNQRGVCANAITEIIGKFQTFSSGDQILEQILKSQKFFQIYSLDEDEEISKCIEGILMKSQMKKYDISTDSQISIFSIPQQHKKAISDFIKKRHSLAEKIEKQSSDLKGKKLHKNVIQYFELIKASLGNEIDDFLNQQLIDFVWKCISQHPNCDILLVTLVKIINYTISKQKISAQKLKIYDNILDLWEKNPKNYRPHLFSIWKNLQDLKLKPAITSEKWDNLCIKFNELLPFYSKEGVKKVERPTNTKLIIDQEDMAQAKASKTQTQNTSAENKEKKAEKKNDPFSEFTFFSSSKPEESKKTEKKEANSNQFADFMNFGK